MKFFAMISTDVPNGTAIRAANKELHKAHLDSASGTLAVLQSGPLLDAVGAEIGSLIIFRAESASQVDEFANKDPYAHAGLVADRKISEWFWRRGNPFI